MEIKLPQKGGALENKMVERAKTFGEIVMKNASFDTHKTTIDDRLTIVLASYQEGQVQTSFGG